jgi:hypothetical protein
MSAFHIDPEFCLSSLGVKNYAIWPAWSRISIETFGTIPWSVEQSTA